MSAKRGKHRGQSWDDFLGELPEGEQIEIRAAALKFVLVQKARQQMRRRKIGVRRLGVLMRTSPSQVLRILDGKNTGISLRSLVRLAGVLGMRLEVGMR